jgi:WXXGXW repeat (2 copies)
MIHMKSYRTCFPLALCLTIGAMAAPIVASAEVAITTSLSPPPPRIEKVEPREGFVWAPGYWEWSHRSYHWVTGSYIFERRRHHWVAGQWKQEGGQWHYLRGRWERIEAPAGLLSLSQPPVKAR